MSDLSSRLSPTPAWQQKWDEAVAARNAGRPERALSLYAQALAEAPEKAILDFDAGNFAFEVNRKLGRLRELYKRHWDDFQVDPQGRGSMLDWLEDGRFGWAFALENLTRAVRHAPPSRASWVRRLSLCISFVDTETAGVDFQAVVRSFRRAMGQWPEALDLRWRYISVLQRAGRTDETEAAYGEISAVIQDLSAPARNVALTLLSWGIWRVPARDLRQRALADFSAIIVESARQWPNSFIASSGEAFLLLSKGHAEAGQEKLRQALTALQDQKTPLEEAFDDLAGGSIENSDLYADVSALVEGMTWSSMTTDEANAPNSLAQGKAISERNRKRKGMALLCDGDVAGALEEYSLILAPHLIQAIPYATQVIADRRIVYHNGMYYAIPREIRHFRILSGIVFRVRPPTADNSNGPASRIARIVRYLRPRITDFVRHHPSSVPVAKILLKTALVFYTVRDVIVSRDYEEVMLAVRKRAPSDSDRNERRNMPSAK